MKQKSKTNERFIMIPHWYYECGLDLIEVNLIARVASWQRTGKNFYESKSYIGKIFGCSTKTISRKFKTLVDKGILIEEVRKGTTTKYRVNVNKLNELNRLDSESLVGTKLETVSPDPLDRESQDKNTKNINNNILRVDEEKGSSSPSKVDLDIFAHELNLI